MFIFAPVAKEKTHISVSMTFQKKERNKEKIEILITVKREKDVKYAITLSAVVLEKPTLIIKLDQQNNKQN